MPVMNGIVTGALFMIPGACTSTDDQLTLNILFGSARLYPRSDAIEKLPNGFITSPGTPDPHLVCTSSFVLYTWSPIDKFLSSPPISGILHVPSSIFQTNPKHAPESCSNFSLINSPQNACLMPEADTISSQTSTTRPTRCSLTGDKRAIVCTVRNIASAQYTGYVIRKNMHWIKNWKNYARLPETATRLLI